MTPRQLADEIERAYDARDRESLHRYVARLVILASVQVASPPADPPVPPKTSLEPSDD